MSGHGLAIVIAVVLVGVTVALAVYASRQLGGTGDQISAGSFLGITGAVALTGARVRIRGGEREPVVRSADAARAGC